MVRGKVELRRIDDKTRRQSSFSKRRTGLLKKARELAVLCDAEVGVIVFSPKGKLSHYPSHPSLEQIIQHYKRFLDAERSINNHVLQSKDCHIRANDQFMNHKEMEEDQRIVSDGSIGQLNISELKKLEEKLEGILKRVRSRKTELLMDFDTRLREQERTVACENQQLQAVVGNDNDGGKEEREPRGSENAGGSSASSTNAASPAPPSTLLQPGSHVVFLKFL